jgi:hypothetical protein
MYHSPIVGTKPNLNEPHSDEGGPGSSMYSYLTIFVLCGVCTGILAYKGARACQPLSTPPLYAHLHADKKVHTKVGSGRVALTHALVAEGASKASEAFLASRWAQVSFK